MLDIANRMSLDEKGSLLYAKDSLLNRMDTRNLSSATG